MALCFAELRSLLHQETHTAEDCERFWSLLYEGYSASQEVFDGVWRPYLNGFVPLCEMFHHTVHRHHEYITAHTLMPGASLFFDTHQLALRSSEDTILTTLRHLTSLKTVHVRARRIYYSHVITLMHLDPLFASQCVDPTTLLRYHVQSLQLTQIVQPDARGEAAKVDWTTLCAVDGMMMGLSPFEPQVLPRMESLLLFHHQNPVRQAVVESFIACDCPSLQYLNLSHTYLPEEGIRRLCRATWWSTLEIVHMPHLIVEREGGSPPLFDVPLSSPRSLQMTTGRGVHERDIVHLLTHSNTSQLLELNLSGECLDAFVSLLTNPDKFPKVLHLCLVDYAETQESMLPELLYRLAFPSLFLLDISCDEITPEIVDALCHCINQHKLSGLVLSGCMINDDMLDSLGRCVDFTSLLYLELSCQDLTLLGLARLVNVCPRLEHLKVLGERFDLASLPTMLSFPRTSPLTLSTQWVVFTDVTGVGV